MLREMGCNAIRTTHNPPAPELLELTDEMGFLVMDESFDAWERKKTPLDFHLIFPDWHEQDLRALIRRDRNHPSVILWSIGNEVGEQFTGEAGAAVAKRLHDIAHDEDPTRPTTTAMNCAKPDMPLPAVVDVISLNYQGEGIRDTSGVRRAQRASARAPQYAAFHARFPEQAHPQQRDRAAHQHPRRIPVSRLRRTSARRCGTARAAIRRIDHVSAYELYAADFGSSADKVFAAQDRHPFVAGEFVWTGWDYLGEPTPYYSSRSSYFGIIDLAGFKKDRFYLYQSRWRPELPDGPHPAALDLAGTRRAGHAGARLHLRRRGGAVPQRQVARDGRRRASTNTASAGMTWSTQPGELKVVAYKDGKPWARTA